MKKSLPAAVPALFLACVGCGSQAQYDRNQVSMNAQLEAANATIPEGAGASQNDVALIGPTADQVGQQMRAGATVAPQR